MSDRSSAPRDFLSRWSRRKAQARAEQSAAVAEVAPQRQPGVPEGDAGPLAGPPAGPLTQTSPGAVQRIDEPSQTAPSAESGLRLPTLEDVRDLTAEADFTPFMARGVAPEVRNAAMKKLFADPHYNVMDGLDVYIDDYSRMETMPAQMLAKLASSRALNLIADDEKSAGVGAAPGTAFQDAGELSQTDEAPTGVSMIDSAQAHGAAQAGSDGPGGANPARPAMHVPSKVATHADPDLQLQPDHASGARPPGRGA